ncbi:fimbrial biogenesis chaperone [Stenotrophomonas maltophilia]|uniref:fimbrial biogenesis chaperone n=1 Tax=Stenotrophomonas maltophilia TaxID=40324 RepID=UPI0016614D75|nr:fimbria/pilus periplasmic chaperone [Stenotrophomonas maltophilia]
MRFNNRMLMHCVLAATALLAAPLAEAKIVVESSRVIYPAGAKEISVRAQNAGNGPVLVQAWASEYGARTSPTESNAPFAMLPPVVRIDEGKGQVFRLRYVGADLPQDRESAFTLTLAEIPATEAGDSKPGGVLSIVIRNRLKLFYRPQSISKLNAASAIDMLRWSVVPDGKGWALQAKNDSPFHVSAVRASVTVNGRKTEVDNMEMLRPYTTQVFPLPGAAAASTGTVTFKYINDHGGTVEHTMPLTTN